MKEPPQRTVDKAAVRAHEDLHVSHLDHQTLDAGERFKILVEHSLAGVYVIEEDRSFSYVNPTFARIFGYTAGEICRLSSVLELVAEKDRATVEENIARRIRGEVRDLRYSFSGLRKDGELIQVEVHGTKHEVDGKSVLIGTLLDVTARHRAVEELRQSEARFRELVEQAPGGVFIADDTSIILMANPRGCEMLGYDPGEIEGKSVFVTYHPDEAEAGQKRMATIADTGREIRFERLMVRKDGSSFPSEVILKRLKSGLWQGVFTDITERRRNEERLRMLSQAVEQSQVSVIVTDVDGSIEYVNPKFTRVTGYSLQEVIGKNPRFLKSGFTSPEEYRKLWQTITSGAPWRGEFHNRKKNGEFYWEDAVISPIRNEQGDITHFLALKEDITQRKSLEQQILHTQRMESLGTLAGGIAHDLNNVLAPILLSSQSMLKKTDNQTFRKLLETVEQSAQRGKDIVRQVLTFARGGTGEQMLIQLRHALTDLERMVQETFPKSILFETDLPHDLRNIKADPTQIHQIFMNLCVNARDAMPQGGTLRITARNFVVDESFSRMQYGSLPGPFVVIAVSDTGLGIPPDQIGKIFDPFFTTKDIGKGTGLGLSTVHALVRNHGGFIRVESKPREGSTFSIYLPAQVSGESVERSQVVESTPMGHGELILIVDDEKILLESVKMILESSGYQTLTADDGTEAVTVVTGSERKIDLAIVDIMMPYMDGTATIRSLKKIDPRMKIIASSGAIAEQKHDLLQSLMVEFLPKPYTADQLLCLIRNVLTSREPS